MIMMISINMLIMMAMIMMMIKTIMMILMIMMIVTCEVKTVANKGTPAKEVGQAKPPCWTC